MTYFTVTAKITFRAEAEQLEVFEKFQEFLNRLCTRVESVEEWKAESIMYAHEVKEFD